MTANLVRSNQRTEYVARYDRELSYRYKDLIRLQILPRAVPSIIGATQKRRDGGFGAFFELSVTYASKPLSDVVPFPACFAPVCRTRYDGVVQSKTAVPGTKAQVLETIKSREVGELKCSDISSQALVWFARELTRSVEAPSCANYFSHLSNIFTVAPPAWGYPLVRDAFDDAIPRSDKYQDWLGLRNLATR